MLFVVGILLKPGDLSFLFTSSNRVRIKEIVLLTAKLDKQAHLKHTTEQKKIKCFYRLCIRVVFGVVTADPTTNLVFDFDSYKLNCPKLWMTAAFKSQLHAYRFNPVSNGVHRFLISLFY